MNGAGLIIVSALTMGVGGSLHCLGMCGPLVLSLPLNQYKKGAQIPAVLLYHAGRIMAYALLGMLIFYFGKTLNLIGISQYLSVALGLLILLNLLLPYFARKSTSKSLTTLRNWQLKALGFVMQKRHWIWLPATGFLNGLLPCGLVYLALATAMATTSIFPAYYF